MNTNQFYISGYVLRNKHKSLQKYNYNTPKNNISLITASKNGEINLIKKILLENNININQIDHIGRTAFIYATIISDYEIMSYLFSKGVDVNIKDYYDCSALDYSLKQKDIQAIDILLSLNANYSNIDPKYVDILNERLNNLKGYSIENF